MARGEDFGDWIELEYRRLMAEGMRSQEAVPRALEYAKAKAVKNMKEAEANPPQVSPEVLAKARLEAEDLHRAATATGADPSLRRKAKSALARYSTLAASATALATLKWKEAQVAAEVLFRAFRDLGTPAEQFKKDADESGRVAAAGRKELEELARAARAADGEALKALEARGRAILLEMESFTAEQQRRMEARAGDLARYAEAAQRASELAGELAREARLASLLPHQVLLLLKSLDSPPEPSP